MAHFFDDEYFYYEPAGQGGWLDTYPDSPHYLLMDKTYKLGLNVDKFKVLFAANNQLSGQSSVYVKLTSSEFMYFSASCFS